MSSPSRPASKLAARDLAELGLMSALMVTTQFALSWIPNVHLTAVLTVVTAVTFGWSALCAVGGYVLVEGLMYGFGVWWFAYLYAWPLLCAAAVLLRRVSPPPLLWAAVTGAHGLLFGAMCALPYVFISGFPAAAAYWVSGIPFDLIHCASNFALTLVLIKPLIAAAQKLYALGRPREAEQ